MTVTDVLQTVLRIEGGSAYAAQMGSLQKPLLNVAAAEGTAAGGAGALGEAIAGLGGPVGIGIAALGGIFAVLGAGVKAFAESEDTIGRLAIRMKNLGNVFPIQELTDFSGKLGQQLGIDDELIAKTGALAAGFGLTRQQIEKALPTVLDISVATKQSADSVLETLFRASRGRTQGLIALGIDPAKIKGDIHDINNLLNQIGSQFAGTAAAFRNTLPGTIDALKVSTGNLLEAMGRNLSPVVVPLLNLLIKGIDQLTKLLTLVGDFAHLPTAATLGGGNASKIAFKGDPEQTEYQRQTAENTGKMTDALVRNVLGGPGSVARAAFTLRDAKLAFRL